MREWAYVFTWHFANVLLCCFLIWKLMPWISHIVKIKTDSSENHTVDQNLRFEDGCSQTVGAGLLGVAQVKHKAQWLTGDCSVPERPSAQWAPAAFGTKLPELWRMPQLYWWLWWRPHFLCLALPYPRNSWWTLHIERQKMDQGFSGIRAFIVEDCLVFCCFYLPRRHWWELVAYLFCSIHGFWVSMLMVHSILSLPALLKVLCKCFANHCYIVGSLLGPII